MSGPSSRTRDTDPVRHQLVNLEVSLQRANAVADQLVRLGVARERIQVTGLGDAEPAWQEVMPAGEAGNRRAEIFIDY
ncbi:MAG: hypothetical protein OHK0024_36110 [Thalassobaculales bacterium]